MKAKKRFTIGELKDLPDDVIMEIVSPAGKLTLKNGSYYWYKIDQGYYEQETHKTEVQCKAIKSFMERSKDAGH